MRFAVVSACLGLLAHSVSALPRESVTFNNVDSNGALNAASNSVLRTTFRGTYQVQRINVTATLQSLATATQPREARIQITRPGGGTTFIVQPFTQSGTFNSLTVSTSIVVSPSQPLGDWVFRFFESFDDGGSSTVDARWTSIKFELDDSLGAALVDIGDVATTTDRHESVTLSAGEVRWVRFSLLTDVTANTSTYLDLDTEGTAISSYDTVMALYDNQGNLVAQDNDSGSNFLSALSFGLQSYSRPGAGNGLPFNGRNGSLRAGTYFLAVGSFPMTCNPSNFDVVSASSATGSMMLNFKGGRYCRADFNNDGVIDLFDYLDFVDEFSSGCAN